MHYHGCFCARCRVSTSPLPVIVMITVALVLLALSSVVQFEVAVSSGILDVYVKQICVR
ncbi:hypothetical protein AtNW77_Chr2g0239351 [Arabidopsis thaliana]|uniref:(thale cress) hypothetical protein n=1 Tax=Arabidopsis thaliana TaxID=3702 RepID=A0A7G2E7X8_ARATH|nr:unnamed protein product [Arabidopsis thaliana]